MIVVFIRIHISLRHEKFSIHINIIVRHVAFYPYGGGKQQYC